MSDFQTDQEGQFPIQAKSKTEWRELLQSKLKLNCTNTGCWAQCTCLGLESNFGRPSANDIAEYKGHACDCPATNGPCSEGCQQAAAYYR